MYIPENACYVLNRLNKNGYDAYLVGGCVRDGIMGNVPNDYDITTNAHPEQILNCFSDCRTLTNGIKHGTVGIVFDKEVIEVTTYRIDGSYSDNRHPDNVEFSSDIEDDLARRDFTINAIACDINGNIIDPYCGVQDIDRRVIKCVGNPDRRFNEDALRILRALRFSSVLDFDIDSDTAVSVHANAHLLKHISAERINNEFSKLICGRRADRILFKYFDVVSVFVPLFADVDDEKMYRMCSALGNADMKIIERLCALFGHGFNADAVIEVLNRLKYDNITRNTVCSVINIIDTEFTDNKPTIKRLIYKYGFNTVLLLCRTKENIGQWSYEQCAVFENVVNTIKNNGECVSIAQLAVDGHDCITKLGVSGKVVGKVLAMLFNAVVEELVNNEYNELMSMAENYVKQLGDFINE